MSATTLHPDHLRAAFEVPAPPTVGLEEEVMLLDARSLDLAPVARELLDATGNDPRFKLELPAAQIELAIAPASRVADATSELAAGRRRLAQAAPQSLRLAAAGTHPFASSEAELNRGERYDALAAEYGSLVRRQLVWALQIHVAIRGADRALAVYNSLRSHLPELAALAANAPFHEGRDSGLASARPLIAQALPRQGLPPALASWEAFAQALRWAPGARAEPGLHRWWWELRLNPAYGTLEVRVPDAQTTVGEVAAIAAVVHCLAVRLADRHDAGEPACAVPTWRIAENRSAAMRGGLDAELIDLASGRVEPARERLERLIDDLEPTAHRLDCVAELHRAREAARGAGAAARQRSVAAERGLPGLVGWLAERFLHDGEAP